MNDHFKDTLEDMLKEIAADLSRLDDQNRRNKKMSEKEYFIKRHILNAQILTLARFAERAGMCMAQSSCQIEQAEAKIENDLRLMLIAFDMDVYH